MAVVFQCLFVIPANAGIQWCRPVQRALDPVVYLLASHRNGTLYIGVTSNLMQRVAQHRAEAFGGFTAEHGIRRENQIRKSRRAWKLNVIEHANPHWRDLALDLGFEPLC